MRSVCFAIGLALVGACSPAPVVDEAPRYPWDALRPAIAYRLPWSTYGRVGKPCDRDLSALRVLPILEDGGVPPFEPLYARAPVYYAPEIAVFVPTRFRLPKRADGVAYEGKIGGWLYVIDASLTPFCWVPIEARGADEAALGAAFWASLDGG